MSHRFNRSAVVILAALFPIAAFSQTATLSIGTALSLDTGTTSTSGGDILWSGTAMKPQGNATAFNVGNGGSAEFGQLTQASIEEFASLSLLSNSAIPASSLTTGDIFVALTNGKNYSKVLVTGTSGTSITLQYTTYGGTGGGSGGPTITGVQNNYSYILPGFPNYGIAPAALFIITGSGLSSPGTAVLQSSASPGIPTTLNGASISVTVNGVTTHPGLYYAIPTQLAAVLPSGTPAGTGTITVSYNGATSAAATIQVVASALGFDTYYGGGTGLGVATSPTTGALYNYTNSASPGSTIVLWGSGLGADPADSDTVFTSTPHAVNVPLTVYIGGIAVTPGYQGASGYPGVNQINVTIPASVQPGCAVAIVAISGSVVSNTVTLPVNAGGGTCSDPALGINGTQLNTLGGMSTYNYGSVAIFQSNATGQNEAFASVIFLNEQGTESASGYGLVSIGNCIVIESGPNVSGTVTTTGLDAGNLSVTGPSGTLQMTAISNPQVSGPTGEYEATLPNGWIPANGGSFTFTGTGGKNVGAFTVSISYTNPLTWTNQNSIATVTRSQGVTVTWTGGESSSYVYIGGSSSSNAGSASFTCYAPVSAGTFTVPSYVLLALPAGPNGFLSLENATTPVSFSATGLNSGAAFAGISFSISPNYQ